MIPDLKGIIWLLLAFVIQIPQMVRSGVFLEPIIVSHRRFASQVFIFLNLNGAFSFSFQLIGDDYLPNSILDKISDPFNLVRPYRYDLG